MQLGTLRDRTGLTSIDALVRKAREDQQSSPQPAGRSAMAISTDGYSVLEADESCEHRAKHKMTMGTSSTGHTTPDVYRSPAGLLALQSLPKVGPVTALAAALHATAMTRLLERHDIQLDGALDRARERIEQYREAGVSVLAFFDERYPDRLRDLPDPPPILYIRGDLSLLTQNRLVAVVGTRGPTRFGTTAATELTAALADDGWGIVSGLAKGIDTIAHQTALKAGAPTIAVMGGGLDRVYPAENKHLAARILDQGGVLVSEQPFGAQPRPQNLIARDRLQSGLSVAVLVAQCGLQSGTMHTARFAAGQGRPVFCPVPNSSNGASDGLRALLERPASELCSILPAWRNAKALCSRLGERPLGRPIEKNRLAEFIREVSLAGEWSRLDRDHGTLLEPLALFG
jgi:DNA processing protein